MRLLYIANMRLPTEKAHGLQIVQNCEAFADAGCDVTLWAARRRNLPAMRAVVDVWAHYGVGRNFAIGRVPTLDLLGLAGEETGRRASLLFVVQWTTFVLCAFLRAVFTRSDLYYSRDELTLLALSLIKPRRALVYECHYFPAGRTRSLQRRLVRRAGTIVAITPRLRDDLVTLGADPERVLVAHDGIRAARFENVPPQDEARRALGWPEDAFVAGYVGRLQTLAMDKGLGTLVQALAKLDGVSLGLVGGPEAMAEALREEWRALGLPESRFLYAGQVPPGDVPRCLSAFDVCAMPHPFTPHFAYYTSPLKLFEYMASQRAIVASDLPGWADVVQDGEQALLVPPGDPDALAGAINRLRDPALRQRLAGAAYTRVMARYTWAARAQMILRHAGISQEA